MVCINGILGRALGRERAMIENSRACSREVPVWFWFRRRGKKHVAPNTGKYTRIRQVQQLLGLLESLDPPSRVAQHSDDQA